MAEYNVFEGIMQGLDDAIAFQKGDKTRARIHKVTVPDYKASDVARLRSNLKLSQHGLADALGVSPRTVEAWEAGRNTPSGSSRHLLFLLEKDSSLVDRLIIR